jgi:hypothetical protein
MGLVCKGVEGRRGERSRASAANRVAAFGTRESAIPVPGPLGNAGPLGNVGPALHGGQGSQRIGRAA